MQKRNLLANMSDSDRDEDEIIAIKRAMKEAKARKKMLLEKSKYQWQQSVTEKTEIEDVMKRIRNDAEEWKKKAAELEFDLREAKYQVTQWTNKYSRLETEKEHQESVYKTQIQDCQLKVESLIRQNDEKLQVVAIECDKLSKLFDTLVRSSEFSHSQTNQHILSKAKGFIGKIRQISTTENFNPQEYRHKMMLNNNNNSSSSTQLISVDSTVDATMLEMCRNLEEENATLTETVNSLKEQLAEAKRESAASQLIPHYRLAIVRSRTYAANLLEQLRREQDNSHALREQLDETYQDLKKVVEEKRKLYQKITQNALEEEEDKYMERDRNILDKDLSSEVDHIRKRSDNFRRTKSGEKRVTQKNYSSSSERRRRNDRDDEEDYDDDEDGGNSQREIDVRVLKKRKEEQLKNELHLLDAQIDSIREKLGKAALQQSQKILNEVLDSNLGGL